MSGPPALAVPREAGAPRSGRPGRREGRRNRRWRGEGRARGEGVGRREAWRLGVTLGLVGQRRGERARGGSRRGRRLALGLGVPDFPGSFAEEMPGGRDEQRADDWKHVTLRWRQILPPGTGNACRPAAFVGSDLRKIPGFARLRPEKSTRRTRRARAPRFWCAEERRTRPGGRARVR